MTPKNPDILLVYAPWHVKFYQAPGLPILANHLLNNGLNVGILNCVALEISHEEALERIRKIDPMITGVSIPFTAMIGSSKKLLELVKKEFPDKLVLCGGYHATIRPQDVADLCDIIVRGEGELTLTELIKKYKAGEEVHDIQGIVYRKEGEEKLTFTAPRPPLENIDYDHPAWHLLDLDKEKLTLYLATRERAFPVQTGKGCPFSCTFCCNSKHYEKVRYRSLENVINEIKYIKKEFGVSAFQVFDETFTLQRKRAEEFCRRLIEENINMKWTAQTRASFVDREIAALLKEAGCVRFGIGVESGDPVVLKAINKRIKLDEAVEAVKIINEAGIVSYAGFIMGHPDDTKETVVRTIEFADRLNPTFVGFRNAIPYPGCVFRDIAEQRGGILTDDYSKYTDDYIVYVPEGLRGYDLKKVRKMAYSYFYWQSMERVERILRQGFKELFRDTLEYGPEIYLAKERGEPLSIEELLDKYCKYEGGGTELVDYEV